MIAGEVGNRLYAEGHLYINYLNVVFMAFHPYSTTENNLPHMCDLYKCTFFIIKRPDDTCINF